MTPLNYPAGSGAHVPPAAPTKPRQKKPRRKTESGGNSQSKVSDPDKDSPLCVLSTRYERDGWQTGYMKHVCDCQDWQNRGCNAVVVWRPGEYRIWCVCEVVKMLEVA